MHIRFLTALLLMAISPALAAKTLERCMQERVKTAGPTLTVGEIQSECELKHSPQPSPDLIPTAIKRLQMEKRTEWNPTVITAHKQNYLLPYTYMKAPNDASYPLQNDDHLDNQEAKIQISFKVPILEDDLLIEGDSLYFGFTMLSFWQIYNSETSASFREINYQPELFYTMPSGVSDEGRGAAARLGIEHQSNGGAYSQSRSWNRVYTQFFYAKDSYLVSFRPWYRIPEDKKKNELDTQGDDNPDIDDYMGYFDIQAVVEYRQFQYSTLVRNNLRSDNRSAVEFGISFPLGGRLRGFAQYFNGYGESLIDYNYRHQRIGVGVLLTDLL